MSDKISKEKRSKIMSSIKGKDTSIEIILRKRLYGLGYRYRKNYTKLQGNPDITFPSKRIVIFVNGDFWHGFEFSELSKRLSKKWRDKIWKNIERDAKTTQELESMGWTVLVFWEHDIEQKLEFVLNEIIEILES